MAQTVIGIFEDITAATNAVDQLTSRGFTMDDIDVSNNSDSTMETDVHQRDRDNSEDGLGDKISRFFSNLFGNDEEETSKYSTIARRGTIVSVHVRSMEEAERAADILDDYGAINVDERASQYNTSSSTVGDTLTGSSLGASSDISTDAIQNDTNTSIPIIEENLHVGKREVATGGMRVRSRIIERPVEESLRLREERVRVDRTPVDRPASESDFTTFREGEIEIRERAEVPIVNKEARVVEEVNIRKDEEEHEEVVRDTVRRTDVDVEQLNSDTSNESRNRL